MIFVDGAVASSMSLPPPEDPLAPLVNEDIAHYLSAGIYRYFFSLLDTGVIDTSPFWSCTRDDQVYVEWETANDNYWLQYMSEHIIPVAIGALQSGLQLTGGNAILFNQAVRQLPDWPLSEATVADLLDKAYKGEL